MKIDDFPANDKVERELYTDRLSARGTPLKQAYPAKRAPKGTKRIHYELSVEQEAYCRARAMGMTQKEALVAIGSKVKLATVQSWEQDKDGLVKPRIDELSRIASENAIIKTGLNREWVISRLMSVTERCMQAEPVRDKDGNPTGEWTFNANGATAALRLLGDTMGMFRPQERKEEDEYAHLSDEDIARIAGQLASEVGIIEDLTRGQEAQRPEQAGSV